MNTLLLQGKTYVCEKPLRRTRCSTNYPVCSSGFRSRKRKVPCVDHQHIPVSLPWPPNSSFLKSRLNPPSRHTKGILATGTETQRFWVGSSYLLSDGDSGLASRVSFMHPNEKRKVCLIYLFIFIR
jgi:hypothetical protein